MPSDRPARLLAFSRQFLLLSRAWRQAADAALAPLGLSYATAQPLMLVHRLDAPRQSALAAALGIEGPSLVRLLDQLAAQGLVTRGDHPTDRRAKTIRLTGKGTALAARAEAALAALRESLMADVSDQELETALRVLNTIAATIEARENAA